MKKESLSDQIEGTWFSSTTNIKQEENQFAQRELKFTSTGKNEGTYEDRCRCSLLGREADMIFRGTYTIKDNIIVFKNNPAATEIISSKVNGKDNVVELLEALNNQAKNEESLSNEWVDCSVNNDTLSALQEHFRIKFTRK